MTAKDQWTELLTCRSCWQSGLVHLSESEGEFFDVKVESLPAGFKILRGAYGQTFFCRNCDREAMTSRVK
jgi:hypothetical protein